MSNDANGSAILSYQHLDVRIKDSCAVISLDFAGKSANILSTAMIAEIAEALALCEANEALTGIILRSAKSSGFVFGADILEFETLSSEDEVRALQASAMRLLDDLETSRLISVAILHGPVLGGGLELALGCDYRLCHGQGRIMAGFPEANLGLMPGFAGTARGARLLGVQKALEMCLSAKPLTSQSALLACGLADGLCDEATEIEEAMRFVTTGKRQMAAFCDAPQWADAIKDAKQGYLDGKNTDHIPHLVAIISHFEEAGPHFEALKAGELSHFPRLMMNAVSANLRRVFALTDKVKKQARGTSSIKTILVIGAGAMGADIATYLCLKGMTVYLDDVNEDALKRAYQSAKTYFERKASPEKARQALGRFTCGIKPDNRVLIDLVIEAAPEKMPIKQQIWQNIEASHRSDCLLATNSSALDLDEIAGFMTAPERLLGLHFFNPATVMPLIEVIFRPQSDAADIARLMQFSLQMGKLPIKVQNSPGFLVNRALLPYIFEAIAAMLEGGCADEIDQALLGYGMPMGPLELADQIGLDICLDVGMRLGVQEDVKRYLKTKIDANELGRKTGKGLYVWDGKKAVRDRADYDAAAASMLVTRMLSPMIAACQQSLDEGHVSERDFVDAAMIYGVGYPRHTGGPLHDRGAS